MLRMLEYLAESLRLDLVVFDGQHRPLIVTHRGQLLLDRLTPGDCLTLIKRLTASFSDRPVAIAHIDHDLKEGWEVAAFPLLDGVAIVLLGSHFPRIPIEDGLRSLYGLTPAEARIACALAVDKNPKGIAAEFGIGLSTVRTHLRVIQSKLQASSQTDLVRRLLSSAASFAPSNNSRERK
jgi:DNA-binding CsgD family transcriptional regulator